MKILITGGAGFLGSHLCDRLLSEENEVVCIDNLYTGRKDNISHNLKNKNYKFHINDVEEEIKIDVDQIYNLACPASPVHYQSNPIKTVSTSVLGAMNVLRLAKQFNAKIFQASTSEVYGDPEVHPQTEDYRGNVNPVGPRACYDEGKRCAETLFFDYNRSYNIDIRVVRIFNTYGPRMRVDDGRVVSNFISQAILGKDITVYGKGEQTRSFCYVDDLINAFLLVMNQSQVSGPINIGNANEFKIIELAEKVIKLTNSKSKIVFVNLPQDDPMQRKPDCGLIKKITGWKPKVELEEGLEKTIKYFRKVLT